MTHIDPLRIIFMGTPEFAVPSLEVLIQNGLNVVAVVTAPDKPQGRGQKMVGSPVKECAVRHGLPVLQPTNLKSPEFLATLKGYNAHLQIVVAFRMLPEAVWAMPPQGTFNLHASLLPQYRGAAPINWAIINGETETGVTTFFLKHEIDTGSIIFQEKEPIDTNDNAGTLYERLMHKGAALVLKTTQAIAQGEHPSTPQPENVTIRHAPKIFKETCQINWNQPAAAVRNFIRGLSPYPAAWAIINGKSFKIYRASIHSVGTTATPGTIDTDQKTFIRVSTADGWLSLEELQAEGKRKMTPQDYLAGNKI
jgi:methionyl-tRNA formyltransferase